MPSLSSMPNDSSSLLHKIYYSNFNNYFQSHYLLFLKELHSIVQQDFYYQQIPNVRFGFPNKTWLTKFHRDSEYKHPNNEYNVNIPITDSFGSAALQIENAPGSEIYIPLEHKIGQFTFIDHINCKHGCILNREEYTLISLDFRFILASEYIISNHGNCQRSLTQKKLFIPGDYYSTDPFHL